MIWLTWRQFRWQAVTAGAVLVVLAAALLATGPGLVSRFDQAGLSTCHATCGTLAASSGGMPAVAAASRLPCSHSSATISPKMRTRRWRCTVRSTSPLTT